MKIRPRFVAPLALAAALCLATPIVAADWSGATGLQPRPAVPQALPAPGWPAEWAGPTEVACVTLSADWPTEPPDERVSLFFNRDFGTVNPAVYRATFEAPAAVKLAAVKVAGKFSSKYPGLILLVNGQMAYEGKAAAVADVTPLLQPGRNTLVVSGSAESTSVGLLLIAGDDALSSPALQFKVQKIKPLRIHELEPYVQAGFDDSSWHPVKTEPSDALTLSEACRAHADARMAALAGRADDDIWRLGLLADKGISIVDWRSAGWAGADRIDPEIRALARQIAGQLEVAKTNLAQYKSGTVTDLAGLRQLAPTIRAAVDLANAAEALSLYPRVADAAAHLAAVTPLAAPSLAEQVPDLAAPLASAKNDLQAAQYGQALATLARAYRAYGDFKAALEDAAGVPVNDLNEALFNRLGWVDVPEMLDTVTDAWGARFNPLTVSWKMNLAGKWRFRLDPQNIGLKEAYHTFGLNDVSYRWQEIEVPGAWEKQGVQGNNPNHPADNPYVQNDRTDGPYNGYAWYRIQIQVPAEWAGNDLVLHGERVDDYDWAYFNDKEIGKTDNTTQRWWVTPRDYRIPKELVNFGGLNVIVWRIYDQADQGGLLGDVELRCPALQQEYENRPKVERPRTTVFTSPLSAAALLTAGDEELMMAGWDGRGVPGPTHVILPLADGPKALPAADGVLYDAQRDGELSANWMLAWIAGQQGANERPILAVFENKPLRIALKAGQRGVDQLTVRFAQAGARTTVARPFRQADAWASGADVSPEVLAKVRFWSRAMLAIPVAFSEFSRQVEPWVLEVTDRYHYLTLRDAWGTEPLKTAPVPPLYAYALKTKLAGVAAPARAEPLGYAVDRWGEQLAVIGDEQVTYAVPLSKLRQNFGFTSFCFSGGDVGVPGNDREVEILTQIGVNSFRPQHNFRGEKADRLVQDCRRYGLNHTFNSDNRLGVLRGNPKTVEEITDAFVTHYAELAQAYKDLPEPDVSYDIINEPANMSPEIYNPAVAKITQAIREHDTTHLIYVETPFSYANVMQFVNLQATGDPLTVYSFHDYDYRLPARWPHAEADKRSIVRQWMPAFQFMVDNDAVLHLGEYGGFNKQQYTNPCAITLLNDFFDLFNQFGMHHHYYSNRGTVERRVDQSLRESFVQAAYRREAQRGIVNYYWLRNRP